MNPCDALLHYRMREGMIPPRQQEINMTNQLNHETSELTISELDGVNGGFLAAFLAAYVAGKALDGELNGDGFVATASKAAKQKM